MPTLEELVETLSDTGQASFRRREAARSLGKLKAPEALDPLLAALADKDRYVARAAAQALGESGDVRAVLPLTGLLTDSDTEVRRDAASALGQIGDPSATSALTAALDDSSYSVKNEAKRALTKVKAHKPKVKGAPYKPGKTLVDVQGLMREALAGTDIKRAKKGLRYSLTVPLPGGRSQKVAVTFDGKDIDGSSLITIHSLCGPADPEMYRHALKMNAKLPYGAISVAKAMGKEHFVLMNTQLARTAQPLEVRKSVLAVAQKADEIEQQLTGEDVL